MDYDDFVIQLGTDAGAPTARVARSLAGESNPEPLLLDLSDGEIVNLAIAFARSAEAARQGRELDLPEVAEPSLAEIGSRLFRALFNEAVRDRYQRSLGMVAKGSGLRLRIEVGLSNPMLTRLHSIPWEYLSADGHFLALNRNISVVRHLSLGLPDDRPPTAPPLSILVLAGEVLTGSDLNLEKERCALEQAWSGPGEVRIHLLPECTLAALRDELLAREYHVLHFMGHGGFSMANGEGVLAFRTEEGQRVWVSGTMLADQLRDRTSLRLVFLNACKTAQASAVAPFAGVATALSDAGIPAVVAMQFPISDVAALALSRTFYRRIAQGDSVDAAVAEGRLAIRRLAPDNTEWGTPVLFERTASGQVVAPPKPPPPRPHRFKVLFLAVLVFLALGAGWLSRSGGFRSSLISGPNEKPINKALNSPATKAPEPSPVRVPEPPKEAPMSRTKKLESEKPSEIFSLCNDEARLFFNDQVAVRLAFHTFDRDEVGTASIEIPEHDSKKLALIDSGARFLDFDYKDRHNRLTVTSFDPVKRCAKFQFNSRSAKENR